MKRAMIILTTGAVFATLTTPVPAVSMGDMMNPSKWMGASKDEDRRGDYPPPAAPHPGGYGAAPAAGAPGYNPGYAPPAQGYPAAPGAAGGPGYYPPVESQYGTGNAPTYGPGAPPVYGQEYPAQSAPPGYGQGYPNQSAPPALNPGTNPNYAPGYAPGPGYDPGYYSGPGPGYGPGIDPRYDGRDSKGSDFNPMKMMPNPMKMFGGDKD